MDDDGFAAVAGTEEAPKEEAQTEAAADQTKTEESESTPAVDEVAALRAQLAKAEKLANDYKSQARGRQKADDRDTALHDEMNSLNRSVAAMLRHTVAFDLEDTSALQEELKSIENDSTWAAAYNRAASMLAEAVNDDDGNRVLDPAGPELREARAGWNEAKEGKNPEGLFQAIQFANKARIQFERAQRQAPDKPDPKGDMEMGITPPGGSASPQEGDAEVWKAYGRGERPFSPIVQSAGHKLGFL